MDRIALVELAESLRQLVAVLEQRRRRHRRGSPEWREWDEDIVKARDLIDVVELLQEADET
jgi:hypothetical protein